jgi:hypothetical protein
MKGGITLELSVITSIVKMNVPFCLVVFILSWELNTDARVILNTVPGYVVEISVRITRFILKIARCDGEFVERFCVRDCDRRDSTYHRK